MLYIFIGIGLLVAVVTKLAESLLAMQREQLEKLPNRPQKEN
jgi:hypothetical protein